MRKRRLEYEAGQRRLAIKRRAIDELERLDLEEVDRQLAFELSACSKNGEDEERVSNGRNSNSVRVWVDAAGAYAHGSSGQDADLPIAFRASLSAPTCVNDASRPTEAQAQIALTSSTFMNRLTNRTLPTFSEGNLEWLQFKHAFELSTRLGGYADSENIARLHECLRGEAKEAVSALMITAARAHHIIEALEARFSNPHAVTRQIIDDIRRVPRSNSGRTDLAVLLTKVQNGVAAMQALN